MYAIVEIAGQQYKVEKDQEIFVHRLEGDQGSAVKFDNVLLLDQGGNITVGAPTVNGAMIQAKIIEHLRGEKVTVFHKKRRKGYQKENGHRQYFSKILIEDILTDGKQPSTPKKEKVKKDTSVEKVVKKAKSVAKEVKEKEDNSVEKPKKKVKVKEAAAPEVIKDVKANTEVTPEDKTEA
jgi:large subunit ribosomal protein L21